MSQNQPGKGKTMQVRMAEPHADVIAGIITAVLSGWNAAEPTVIQFIPEPARGIVELATNLEKTFAPVAISIIEGIIENSPFIPTGDGKIGPVTPPSTGVVGSLPTVQP